MRYKYILFDLDGTLIDSFQAIVATINDTLEHHGFVRLEPSNKGFFGRKIYSDLSDKIDPSILLATHIKLQEHHFSKNKLFPNAIEILKTLKESGCVLAVVTSANKNKVNHLIDDLGLRPFFEHIITEADVNNRKPHPEPFQKAYANLGLSDKDKSNTLMVGDSEPDIVGAKNFGIDSVAVTFSSYENNVKEYNPTYVIDSFVELLSIIGIPYE